MGTVDDAATSTNSQLPPGVRVRGVTFSDAALTSSAAYNGIPVCRDGVWLEGTAQLTCALAAQGDRRRRAEYLGYIAHAHRLVGAGQKVGGKLIAHRGLVAASSLLDTGFGYG